MAIDIYLTRISLNTRAVLGLDRQLRLPYGGDRTGYLAHAALAGLFRQVAPKPFVIERETLSTIDILGYGQQTADQLNVYAQEFATPEAFSCLVGASLVTKVMPNFALERQLGFTTRVCPVRRFARGSVRAGQEIDAFLHECEKAGKGEQVNRDKVYLQWLDQQMERIGAKIETAALDGFELERQIRRSQANDHGRQPKIMERPEVHVSGVLKVLDPDLLRQGSSAGWVDIELLVLECYSFVPQVSRC